MPLSRKTAAALLLAALLAPAPAAARQVDTTAARADTSAVPAAPDTARPDSVSGDTVATAADAGGARPDGGSAAGAWTAADTLLLARVLAPLIALGALGWATVALALGFGSAIAGGQAAEVTSHWGGLGGGLGGWRISPALSYLLGALFFGSLLTFLALRVMDFEPGSRSAAAGTQQTPAPAMQAPAKQPAQPAASQPAGQPAAGR